ncbi:MAG: AAA family ATPase, partial [Deltaproteobacteria bacterium]|nr:AAA family ATPase [Deltaproteobacteria bacterium]
NTAPRTPSPDPWFARGQCIEHYGAGEAYLPVLEALGRLCRSADGERLIPLLNQHAPTWLVQMPTFLSPPDYEALQRRTQGVTRERMLRELAEALEVITAERPLVLVLEDLHWSDPSTLDLLSLVARRTEPARLLLIGTYRPVDVITHEHPLRSVKAELQLHGHCQEFALELLSEATVAEYLEIRLATGAQRTTLVHKLARLLHQRTEGNPLFLVAMVEDIITRGVVVQTEGGWELREERVREDEIPESIRQLVVLQRERLAPETQHLLGAASIAGLEFSAAAVAAALETTTVAVERQCEQLVERHQFLRRVGVEEWPDGTLAARYGFLHALYQQLWHERVSPTQLQHYHLRIGEQKELAYRERSREIAAELAVHFEQGREYAKAVQYLQQAGENDVRRSAHQEAVTLLTKGLELLQTLPDTLQRTQQELSLHLRLGGQLIITKGYAASEVKHTYNRAKELCQQVGEVPQLFPVLRGLWEVSIERAELLAAQEFAEQMLRLAKRTQDSRFLVWSYEALGNNSFYRGELGSARAFHEQAMALYQPSTYRTAEFAQDPGVSCLSIFAFVLWCHGYPDQALARSQQALRLARDLFSPYDLVMALNTAASVHHWRGELDAAQALEAALTTLADEHGFHYWAAQGHVRRGRAGIEQGQDIETAVVHIQCGIGELQAMQSELARPYELALLAEAYREGGKSEEGLQAVTKALVSVNDKGLRLNEAWLYRLKDELTLQQGKKKSKDKSLKSQIPNPQPPRPNTQEAEACFLKAIEVARRQQAKSFELQATTSLARLWQQQGKVKQAHTMLSAIYNWFTEGFETKDLQEAKALIEELKN